MKEILKRFIPYLKIECPSCHQTFHLFDARQDPKFLRCPLCQHNLARDEINKQLIAKRVKNRRKKLKIERGPGLMLIRVPNSKLTLLPGLFVAISFIFIFKDWRLPYQMEPWQLSILIAVIVLFIAGRPWRVHLDRSGIEIRRFLSPFTSKASWQETIHIETPATRPGSRKPYYLMAKNGDDEKVLLQTFSKTLLTAVLEEISEFKLKNGL